MLADSVDLDACRVLSAKHGLPLDFVVKEFRVFDALGELAGFNSSEADGELVFKGGTALNKIFLAGSQRFSEDLDFDLASIRGVKEAWKFVERIGKSMEGKGFEPRGIRKLGRREPSLQVELGFDSPLGKKDFVRLDFALKHGIAEKDVATGLTARSSFTERTVAGLRAYSLDGLVARKTCALASRCEGKDVFDVVQSLPLASEALPAVTKRMLAAEKSSLTVKQLFSRAAQVLREANYSELRNRVNPYLPLALRPKDAAAWRGLALTLAGKMDELSGV
ncbi:TPA: hypothetical protein HA318_01570 [Candidatus Micrarchaeota archaeon]|nr:MAG: hypothetical protein AUJ65_03870 [Candidatus Micrarchaeota archaeon CG1_02_51_15]HII38673.1 hypothetical protein [Candidatus Micrarchaeota archaeon]